MAAQPEELVHPAHPEAQRRVLPLVCQGARDVRYMGPLGAADDILVNAMNDYNAAGAQHVAVEIGSRLRSARGRMRDAAFAITDYAKKDFRRLEPSRYIRVASCRCRQQPLRSKC